MLFHLLNFHLLVNEANVLMQSKVKSFVMKIKHYYDANTCLSKQVKEKLF